MWFIILVIPINKIRKNNCKIPNTISNYYYHYYNYYYLYSYTTLPYLLNIIFILTFPSFKISEVLFYYSVKSDHPFLLLYFSLRFENTWTWTRTFPLKGGHSNHSSSVSYLSKNCTQIKIDMYYLLKFNYTLTEIWLI